MRQKLKQKWTIFAALAVIIMTGCVLFYATNPVQAAHKHSYRWVIKKNATCTSEGYKNYECSCGSCTGSQTIPKTPHNFNLNAATCTTAKKCRTCGYVAQGATGHSWNRSAATCTASKSCTKCGAVSQSALGHCYVQVTTKQPTCGACGTFETKCSRCGIGSPTGNGTIPATGMHTWDRAEATCTAAKKCKTCGTVGQAAKGHNYYWVEVVSPTCAQVGRRDLRCATCGYVSDSQTLEKVPSHVMTVTRVEPTSTTAGYVKKHCTICSYVESNTVLPKLPSYCGVILNPKNGEVNKTISVVQGDEYGSSLPTVEKTGYDFLGWYTAATGGTKITSKSIVPSTSTTQLYAHWKVKEYEVTFNANGGTGGPISMKKRYGVASVIPEEVPSMYGYGCIGWAETLADANAKKVKYKPNGYYTRNENLTLYAVWGHPFFENNPRFEPVDSIKEPVNSGVEALKKTVEKTNGVMLAYKEIYENRGIKKKPIGMSDDEYLTDIWNRSLVQRIVAKTGTVASYAVPSIMIGKECCTFLDYYYSCKGGKVIYDATNLVYCDPALAYFLTDQLNLVMDQLQMNLVKGETVTFADKDAAGTFNFRTSPEGKTLDTVTTITNLTGAFSVGEVWYCMSGKCSFDGFMYKLDFEFYIQDYYDYYTPLDYKGDNQSEGDIFGVYNDELAYLVYRGKAMPFETTGIFKDSVEWPATRAIGGR